MTGKTCDRCGRPYNSDDSLMCYYCNQYFRARGEIEEQLQKLSKMDVALGEKKAIIEKLNIQLKESQHRLHLLETHIRSLEKGVRHPNRRKVRIK